MRSALVTSARRGNDSMTRIVTAVAVVLSTAGFARASTCPVLSTTQRGCQESVAKAGATYAKSALGAIQKCLQAIQSGKIAGDPATVCLADPPIDPATAAALAKADAKVGI